MGRPVGSKTALTDRMVFAMTPLMKELIRESAKARNVPDGHIVREAVAAMLGLDVTHVDSIYKRTLESSRVKMPEQTTIKRVFRDVPHPLEAAFRNVALPKGEDEDA